MLTAKEVQDLLQVDRSTVYRMAEDGRLPAIKVGKQWRFPSEQIEGWFQGQITVAPTMTAVKGSRTAVPPQPTQNDLATLLPAECVQLIQDSFAASLETMLVVTDMEGNPITQASNPCGLFDAVITSDESLQRCVQSWQDLASVISL
ncbi:MAG: helix-turn-helix domain-containing protein, partial [Anaerolineales bacterium]|nr:helix-turn-helix domain-containing protein [Anaerolineales bacterium]